MGKEPDKQSLFARQATGLRKNASFLDVVSVGLSNMSIGVALGSLGLTLILVPTVAGANLVYSSIFAFGLTIPMVIVYSIMIQRMPRTGGDYIWVSRTFGGFIGGTSGFVAVCLNTLPYLSLVLLSAVLAIGSVGVSLGNQSFLGLAIPGGTAGSSSIDQIIVGFVIFTILILINILRPSAGFKILTVLIIAGLIALFVAIFTLLSAGNQGVVNYMGYLNSIGANATYSSLTSSYTGGSFNFGATIFLLPFFAIFVYPWFNANAVVGSEIRGKSALKWSILISSTVTFALVTIALASMYYVGGIAFINEALSNPQLVLNYSFNFWTLAMGVTTNSVLGWIIGGGWILWTVAVLAYNIIGFSRYLLAMSFDRFIPATLSYVSPRFGSPVIANIICYVVVLGVAGAASFFYGRFTSLYGIIVAPMVYFAIVGLTAVVYARRHEKGSIKGILIVMGILEAIIFSFVTYQFLAYPAVWGGNALAYGIIVAGAIGISLVYLATKQYYKRRGIDTTLAFKEIPPE